MATPTCPVKAGSKSSPEERPIRNQTAFSEKTRAGHSVEAAWPHGGYGLAGPQGPFAAHDFDLLDGLEPSQAKSKTPLSVLNLDLGCMSMSGKLSLI